MENTAEAHFMDRGGYETEVIVFEAEQIKQQLIQMMNQNELLEERLKEATYQIERELQLDNAGWIQLGVADQLMGGLDEVQRKWLVWRSRRYYNLDPLASQAIAIWTNYSFGGGITVDAKDENTQAVIDEFWKSPANRRILSASGQIKSSNKLLVDGEVFFALFLGPDGVTIRWLNPDEITEIITNPEDREDVRYYKRVWSDTRNHVHIDYYRSTSNKEDKPTPDATGKEITSAAGGQPTEALIYHLAFNTIGQRGMPLLTPVLDWIQQYRRFLASRVAVMLALARFAWNKKVKGGSVSIAAAKDRYDQEYPQAASVNIENEGTTLTPIKTDTGAKNAYNDGRQLKLQVAAGTGIPEQYFGDISTGNLATAKTVELPMLKQFQAYQTIWADAYEDILNVVMEHENVPENKRTIDIDFPPIAPKDAKEAAEAMVQLLQAFPEFSGADEVKQVALQNMGINNIVEVLEKLKDQTEEIGDLNEVSIGKLTHMVRKMAESFGKEEHDHEMH